MIQSSQPRQIACEVCGATGGSRFVRNQAARGHGARYVNARLNRTRVDCTYWDIPEIAARLGAFDSWRNKLVCCDCYAAFSHALNE